MRLIYERQIVEPERNLAMEETLVRTESAGSTLFIYINDRSVVLGKHQAVAVEVDPSACRTGGIEIHRRISGGGAVYHDGGNLNIALIDPRDPARVNRYEHLFDPIREVLRERGIVTTLDERNNLRLEDGRKVSGSAQFLGRSMMLTHCTLLVNADLDRLRSSLSPTIVLHSSAGVPSVGASVANLADVGLVEAIGELAIAVARRFDASAAPVDDIQRFRTDADRLSEEKYSTWKWQFGRSPKARISRSFGNLEIEMTVERGRIADPVCTSEPINGIDRLLLALTGIEYERIDDAVREFRAINTTNSDAT